LSGRAKDKGLLALVEAKIGAITLERLSDDIVKNHPAGFCIEKDVLQLRSGLVAEVNAISRRRGAPQ